MSDTNNLKFNLKQFWLAKLALLAQKGTNRAEGPVPTDEELAMLYDNRLDFSRKQQIMSHINANPDLMQQWISLLEILNEDKVVISESNGAFSKIIRLITSWQGLAGGMLAASLVVVLVMNQPSDELVPSVDVQTVLAETDSSGKPNIPIAFISPDIRAIAFGYNSAKITAQKALPHGISSEGSSLELSLYQNYFNLGSFIASEVVNCETDAAENYTSALQRFLNLASEISSNSFISLNPKLSSITKETNQQQFCSLLNEFLLSEF